MESGVQYVIHAFGPIWTDYPIAEETFGKVVPRIKRTVRRSLSAAARVGVSSVGMPAVSGGIFTHWSTGSDIKQREQRAARRAVVEAVLAWIDKHGDTSGIARVELCDLPRKQLGHVDMFVEEFDAVMALRHQTQDAAQKTLADAAPAADHGPQPPGANAPSG